MDNILKSKLNKSVILRYLGYFLAIMLVAIAYGFYFKGGNIFISERFLLIAKYLLFSLSLFCFIFVVYRSKKYKTDIGNPKTTLQAVKSYVFIYAAIVGVMIILWPALIGSAGICIRLTGDEMTLMTKLDKRWSKIERLCSVSERNIRPKRNYANNNIIESWLSLQKRIVNKPCNKIEDKLSHRIYVLPMGIYKPKVEKAYGKK